eukprot:12370110-Ditylum_brightwellii.AAC.1
MRSMEKTLTQSSCHLAGISLPQPSLPVEIQITPTETSLPYIGIPIASTSENMQDHNNTNDKRLASPSSSSAKETSNVILHQMVKNTLSLKK